MNTRTAISLLAMGLLIGGAATTIRPPEARAEPSTAPATQPAKKEKTGVYHITGLFSHDREADLREAVGQIEGVRLTSIDFDFAEATFTYDPAKAFPDTKPEDVTERLNQLLLESSDRTFSLRPRSTVERDKLEHIQIDLAPLDCKACALGVHELVTGIAGVEQAAVDMKKGKISALIDPRQTSRDALRKKLREREVTVLDP